MKKSIIIILVFLLSSCFSSNYDKNLSTFGDFGNSGGMEQSICYYDKINGKIICSGENKSSIFKEGELNKWTYYEPIDIDLPNINIKNFSFGNGHLCVSDDTNLYCKGSNNYGQVGKEYNRSEGIVKNFYKINKKGILQLSMGYGFTCVLLDSGDVECIGKVDNKEYGHDFTRIDLDSKIIELSSSDNGIIMLTSNKDVYSYDYRIKGYSKFNVNDIDKIYSGYSHSCSLSDNNTVNCWGDNSSGQLGTKPGSLKDRFSYSNVDIDNVASMSLGALSSCALINDGTVKCWGDNSSGQLGVGKNIKNSIHPITVLGINNAVDLNCSHYSCCVLLKDDEYKCWGDDIYGFSGI